MINIFKIFSYFLNFNGILIKIDPLQIEVSLISRYLKRILNLILINIYAISALLTESRIFIIKKIIL